MQKRFYRGTKSQAALEFLTTYAWAFLVILITLGALYYFGVFDFAKFLPQRCLFTSQFECLDFSFVGDDVRFRLLNNIGETINIVSFDITDDSVTPLTCSAPALTYPFPWERGVEQDFIFDGCQDGVFITGERTEAKITMVYCSPATSGCPEHTVIGKITSIVNEE
jgi:hypothetical protein